MILYSEGPAVPTSCKVFQLSSDVRDLGRIYATELSCMGDIKASLAVLLPMLDHRLARHRGALAALREKAATIRARVLALYGFQGNREPTEADREHVLARQRADGSAPGRGALLEGLSATQSRVGYVDLCWSAEKSVSLAWAFAPTEAERAIIAAAHCDVVDAAMRHAECELGRARKGKAGHARR